METRQRDLAGFPLFASLFAAIVAMDQTMTDTRKTGWRRLGGGFAVSLLLHGLAVAVFLMSFDNPVELGEQEQAIEVTLVAPPEEPEPEPTPEAAEEPQEEPAEPEASEPPPEPEAEAQPVPEPLAPLQQPQAEEQPLPPEAPVPIARPLLRLAERDQSPKQKEGKEEAEQAEDSAKAASEPPSETARDSRELPNVALPEAPAAEQNTALNDEDNTSAGSADAGESGALVITKTPVDAAEEDLKPRDVKRFLSHSFSEDEVATVSMASLTREERVMDLCGAELSLQLRSGSPRYDVEYLPGFKPGAGNIVNYPKTAFRERGGGWFNLAVVCEVDDKATRVVRFAYVVGKTVPRAEWAERGFPDS